MEILTERLGTQSINGEIVTPVVYRLNDHEDGTITHNLPGDHTDKTKQELITLINDHNFKMRYADRYAVESIDELKEQINATNQHVQMVSITLGQLAAEILMKSKDEDLIESLLATEEGPHTKEAEPEEEASDDETTV